MLKLLGRLKTLKVFPVPKGTKAHAQQALLGPVLEGETELFKPCYTTEQGQADVCDFLTKLFFEVTMGNLAHTLFPKTQPKYQAYFSHQDQSMTFFCGVSKLNGHDLWANFRSIDLFIDFINKPENENLVEQLGELCALRALAFDQDASLKNYMLTSTGIVAIDFEACMQTNLQESIPEFDFNLSTIGALPYSNLRKWLCSPEEIRTSDKLTRVLEQSLSFKAGVYNIVMRLKEVRQYIQETMTSPTIFFGSALQEVQPKFRESHALPQALSAAQTRCETILKSLRSNCQVMIADIELSNNRLLTIQALFRYTAQQPPPLFDHHGFVALQQRLSALDNPDLAPAQQHNLNYHLTMWTRLKQLETKLNTIPDDYQLPDDFSQLFLQSKDRAATINDITSTALNKMVKHAKAFLESEAVWLKYNFFASSVNLESLTCQYVTTADNQTHLWANMALNIDGERLFFVVEAQHNDNVKENHFTVENVCLDDREKVVKKALNNRIKVLQKASPDAAARESSEAVAAADSGGSSSDSSGNNSPVNPSSLLAKLRAFAGSPVKKQPKSSAEELSDKKTSPRASSPLQSGEIFHRVPDKSDDSSQASAPHSPQIQLQQRP